MTPHHIVSGIPPEQRRKMADRQIASLNRQARFEESEGAYTEAQRCDDAAADWDFWATYGVTREEFAEVNS